MRQLARADGWTQDRRRRGTLERHTDTPTVKLNRTVRAAAFISHFCGVGVQTATERMIEVHKHIRKSSGPLPRRSL